MLGGKGKLRARIGSARRSEKRSRGSEKERSRGFSGRSQTQEAVVKVIGGGRKPAVNRKWERKKVWSSGEERKKSGALQGIGLCCERKTGKVGENRKEQGRQTSIA